MCPMNKEIKNRVFNEFSEEDREAAFAELVTITLQHVMANSQANLDSTWISILKLSNGNLDKLIMLVKAAKEDFRDVIYWATLEEEK